MKLLAALGDECIGAVSFGTVDRTPDEGYSPFDDESLEALALKGYNRACFEREANSIHFASREAERLLDSLAEAVPDAVCDAARELDAAGCATAVSVGDRIALQAASRAKSL